MHIDNYISACSGKDKSAPRDEGSREQAGVAINELYIFGGKFHSLPLYILSERKSMDKKILRGEIYFANLDPAIGSEQGGKRPVLVLQNDIGNRFSNTVIVAALTSQSKPNLPTHLMLPKNSGVQNGSMVLLEQLRTLDKSRLGEYVTFLDGVPMSQINTSLAISLGLTHKPFNALVMSLCPVCARAFIDLGDRSVRRATRNQPVKELCTLCGVRMGFDYEVVKR